MLLGVPVLKRYDLLEKLIASAEAGTLKPDTYLIVDNGGELRSRLERSQPLDLARARGAEVLVLSPVQNIGVAASWNAILEKAGDEPVVISNDDVELDRRTLEDLMDAYEVRLDELLISDAGADAGGWCLFIQSPELMKTVGPYDESFSPAYYEDSDYRWRMKLVGIEPALVEASFKHAVRGSWSEESRKHIRRSLEQFERKWGGDPRDEASLFKEPFDGAPVVYPLRKRSYLEEWRKLERKIYRWDVINEVLRLLGGQSYLEIGVASGESMRQVRARAKWGVDPSPTPEGAVACSVLVREPSDLFFALLREGSFGPPSFDVAFVDGLHHAVQAYRDIVSAIEVAGARAVIVHDSSPTTEAMQRVPAVQGEWTGDVWKAIAQLRAEGKHTVRTVDADYGVAIVLPNRPEEPLKADWKSLEWPDLEARRGEILGLLGVDEWEAWLSAALCSGGSSDGPRDTAA